MGTKRLFLLLVVLSPALLLLHWLLSEGSQGEREERESGVEEEVEEYDEKEENMFEEVIPVWSSFDPNEVRQNRDIFFIGQL